MDTLAALYAPGSPEADYWQARHRLATTARRLNDKLVSADITPELADTIREDLERIAARLETCEQVSGLVEMGRKADRGSRGQCHGRTGGDGGTKPSLRTATHMAGRTQPDHGHRDFWASF